MPQVARSAPLGQQVKAVIRKVLAGRSGSGVDAETEKAVQAMLQHLVDEAHATGFTEARESCTLCSIVRVEHNRKATEDEDVDA